MWEGSSHGREQDTADDADNEDDDFGDDFDDFAEGGEGDDVDFGDFDEAEDETTTPQPQPPSQFPTTPDILKGLVSSVPSISLPDDLLPPFLLRHCRTTN